MPAETPRNPRDPLSAYLERRRARLRLSAIRALTALAAGIAGGYTLSSPGCAAAAAAALAGYAATVPLANRYVERGLLDRGEALWAGALSALASLLIGLLLGGAAAHPP